MDWGVIIGGSKVTAASRYFPRRFCFLNFPVAICSEWWKWSFLANSGFNPCLDALKKKKKIIYKNSYFAKDLLCVERFSQLNFFVSKGQVGQAYFGYTCIYIYIYHLEVNKWRN